MLLYVEALCTVATAAQSRAPLAHLLGGLAFSLLGAHLWVGALVGLMLPLALAVQHRADGEALARAALALFYWAGLAVGALLHARRRPPAPPLDAARRYTGLAALSLLVAWRLDDVLCVSRFPVGLVRSFVIWLGAALADAWLWAPLNGAAEPHLFYVLLGTTAYALHGARVGGTGAPMWTQTAIATAVAAAAAAVARARAARPKRA